MTTAYTSLLGLALPVQGELSGQWGDMVDNAITSYVDTAVAGTQSITGDNDVTLSITNGDQSATNLAQVGSGTTGSAQYAIINCIGSRTAARTITVPASSREYSVINATSGGFAVNIVGAGPTTGISVANGEKCVIAWNGSDYVKVASTSISIATGTLPVANGGTGLSSGTSGGVLAFTAAGTLASSAALAANALVIGGGAGVAPATTTTGTGVVTALGNATNATGGLVTVDGSATLVNKTISGASNTLTVDGTNSVGYLAVPQNAQTGAYQLVLADSGKQITKLGTTAYTVTIPANGSVAFPIGTAVTFINTGASGNMTISITTDTLLLAGGGSTGSRTLAPYGMATAVKVNTTLWFIAGTNLT